MKPTTQSSIIDYIRRNQNTPVNDIGRALGKTRADIRHHLAILENNNIVEIAGHIKGNRGRPGNVYRLSTNMIGDRLEELCSILLSTRIEKRGAGDYENALKELGLKLAGSRNNEGKNIIQRLNQIVENLNELHYQARWEASGSGPRIILGHCPYAAIIARHPELCKIDSYELEARLNLPVQQCGILEPTTLGVPICTFQVRG